MGRTAYDVSVCVCKTDLNLILWEEANRNGKEMVVKHVMPKYGGKYQKKHVQDVNALVGLVSESGDYFPLPPVLAL